MISPAPIASTIPATVSALATLAHEVRPHPAVAIARAERLQGLTRRRAAHHRGVLTRTATALEQEVARLPEGRRKRRAAAWLAGVRAELSNL